MAIVGFLVHCVPEESRRVEAELSRMENISTYGVHQDCYVVGVVESPARGLENIFDAVHALDGVLTSYVTSLTMEDE